MFRLSKNFDFFIAMKYIIVTNLTKMADVFISSIKAVSVLALTTIFMYWSISAIKKYISVPISSTVTYKFGDDGYGNINFPVITICLDSFKRIALSGMSNNCSMGWRRIDNFHDALRFCTYDSTQSRTQTTTTECEGLFGCMFSEDEEVSYSLFKKIEDLINASKTLNIMDILDTFQFGDGKDKISVNHNLGSDLRYEYLKKYWEPTLHYQRGFCYTFDPSKYGKYPVLFNGNLLQITLGLDVS